MKDRDACITAVKGKIHAYKKVSDLLRDLYFKFNMNKTDIAFFIMPAIVSSYTEDDIVTIRSWDVNGSGIGFDDIYIDEHLHHLLAGLS